MSVDYILPLVIFISLTLMFFIKGKYTHIEFKYLALILVVFLVPKYEVLDKPFFGLEYEDAYTFQVDSRDISEHLYAADPFRIQIENYDIENNRGELWSYNGHYTAFSSLVGTVNMFLGYDQNRAIQVNFLISYFIHLLLFSLVLIHTRNSFIALVSVLIYSMSPGINLFQTSALTETFSSFSLIIYITALFTFFKIDNKEKYYITFLILSLIMCILIKRENMVVFITLPLIFFQLYKYKNVYGFIFLFTTLSSYLIFVQPFSAEFQEAKSLNRSTFDFEYVLIQLPVYLKSLLQFKEYGIGLIICMLSFVILAIKKITVPKESIVILTILLGYVFTYCFHYRSSYFVETGNMSTFETYRYANNFFILIPLIIAFNISAINQSLKTGYMKKTIFIFIVAAYILSISNSIQLRTFYSEVEYQNRFSLIQKTIDIVRSSNVLEPILVADIAFVAMVLNSTPFDNRIQEFRPNRNYSKYKNRKQIYYLLPENRVKKHFDRNNYLVIRHLKSGYILFQLKE